MDGKVAVVTGAAGGIGSAISSLLAAEGAAVVVADLDGDAARRRAGMLQDGGLQAVGLALDIADPESVASVVDDVVSTLGRIDLLVNNAAATTNAQRHDGPLAELDDAVWDVQFGVNAKGTMLMTRAVLRHMLTRGSGVFVHIASEAALTGAAGIAYASSKGAVIAFSLNLATTYAAQGIRSNVITPGLIGTDVAVAYIEEHFGPEPLAGAGRPVDIAHAVLYLGSDEASFVSGQVLRVTGAAGTLRP
jgi:NAD(P)-dependent dehydrogenase (short-subunit alcohol dehydrogenase family)